ncbi:YgcG family protein [Leptospira sp. WS39.C2]
MKKILFSLVLLISCSKEIQSNIIIQDYVDDRVSILSKDYVKKTSEKLSNFAKKTKVQIVVLLVDNIGKNDLDTYVNQIANENKIGEKYVNNGILIFLSKNDKKIRINVGCGLEWIISDNVAKNIIDTMIPDLKAGKFELAFNYAINKIISMSESVSWNISDKSLTQIEKSDLGSIFQFRGIKLREEPVTNLEYDNQSNESLVLKTKEGIEINLLITLYRYYTYFIDEKKERTITARLVKTNPLTFQLLGVER